MENAYATSHKTKTGIYSVQYVRLSSISSSALFIDIWEKKHEAFLTLTHKEKQFHTLKTQESFPIKSDKHVQQAEPQLLLPAVLQGVSLIISQWFEGAATFLPSRWDKFALAHWRSFGWSQNTIWDFDSNPHLAQIWHSYIQLLILPCPYFWGCFVCLNLWLYYGYIFPSVVYAHQDCCLLQPWNVAGRKAGCIIPALLTLSPSKTSHLKQERN